MQKKHWSLVTIASFLLALTYCENHYFSGFLERSSSVEPTSTNETPIPVPTGGDEDLDYFAVDLEYPAPTNLGTVRPEFLFIVDSSGSMIEEVDALVGALGGWLENLQSQGVESFCVDVMPGHVGAKTGRFQAADGNAKCLCTDDLSIPQIVAKFEQNIAASSSNEGASDGGEAMLYSLHQAMTNPDKISANQADGCMRNDSALIPIILSDEDDLMSAPDATVSPNCQGDAADLSDGNTIPNIGVVEFDNSDFPAAPWVVNNSSSLHYNPLDGENCNEQKARLKYYSEATPTGPGGTYKLIINPQTIADEVLDYNDALPSLITAVDYHAGAFPVGGENGPGWGQQEVAAIFGVETADLATASNQASFNAQMNIIADQLVDVLFYRYKYDLPEPVCEGQEDSVEVRVNGTLIADTKYDLNSLRTWIKFKPNFNWPVYGTSPIVAIDYTRCE